MRAVRLHAVGGPKNLTVETVDAPVPQPGEMVVRVRAAAFNRRDVFITQGRYPNIALPAILGSDGAGEVAAVGDGAAGPPIGARVIVDPMLCWGADPRVWGDDATILGMPQAGTFAQYVCVPARNVHPAPEHLSNESAAALPLAGLTAYRAVFTRAQLRKDETILITGIGGGVQTFVLLFAKHIGARTIVTSGSDEKLERAKALGADVAINYRTDADWHKTARKAGPIDVVVDSAGGETFARCIEIVRPGARIVTYGGTTGDATVRMFPIFWKHLTIMGTSMGSPQDFASMLNVVNAGKLEPAVDSVYDMENVAAAAEAVERNTQFGKVILRIG